MGARHDPQRVDRGVIVEHHPAAAIDLKIDQPRRDHAALQPRDLGAFRHIRHDADDAPPLDQQRLARDPGPAVENLGPEISAQRHTVSVTFLRWRGASGLMPRSAATSLTME